jgi:TP53 regulating kinase-like protein
MEENHTIPNEVGKGSSRPKNSKKTQIVVPFRHNEAEIIHHCAESTIMVLPGIPELEITKPVVLKYRLPKKYRIKELEETLSKTRIKQEVANLAKARRLGVLTPEVFHVDYDNKVIYMEHLGHFITLKRYISELVLNEAVTEHFIGILRNSGRACALLHNGGVIHGDLTSSNIMINPESAEVYYIDFGLSFASNNTEDKAVDLYVFEKSLLCERNSQSLLGLLVDEFYLGYGEKSQNFEQIFNRLQKVKLRGRKKVAFG